MDLQRKLVTKPIQREEPDKSHIVRVIPAETWLIPGCNYSNFAPEHEDSATFTNQTLREFLWLPYVVDDFENHEERRRWRLSRRVEGLDVVDVGVNALRLNSLIGVNYAVQLIDRLYAGPNGDEVSGAIAMVNAHTPVYSGCPATRPYDKLDTSDKICFVKEMKSDVFELLKALSR